MLVTGVIDEASIANPYVLRFFVSFGCCQRCKETLCLYG